MPARQPKKTGAGLLFTSDQDVLLLLRSSKHNDKTWGLPGGNADVGDASLLETAKREAIEEMGMLPGSFNVVKEHKVVRGKGDEKHYTVFECQVDPQAKRAFAPQLNHEHSEWRWVHQSTLSDLPLHPVVGKYFKHNEKVTEKPHLQPANV